MRHLGLQNVDASLASAGSTRGWLILPIIAAVSRQIVADAWGEHWCVYLAAWFGDVLPEFGDRMDPTVRRLIEHGLKLDAVTFKRLELVRQRAWEQLAAVHRDFDALLCPTMAQLPLPIDTDEYAQYRTEPDGRYFALDMTSQFNFTSPCPARCVVTSTAAPPLRSAGPPVAWWKGRRGRDPRPEALECRTRAPRAAPDCRQGARW